MCFFKWVKRVCRYSTGERAKEAKHINSSLTALGKVVLALSSATAAHHIPFSDAKLTRLLKNSLSGGVVTPGCVRLVTWTGYRLSSICILVVHSRVSDWLLVHGPYRLSSIEPCFTAKLRYVKSANPAERQQLHRVTVRGGVLHVESS
jgi:hypothetical protein